MAALRCIPLLKQAPPHSRDFSRELGGANNLTLWAIYGTPLYGDCIIE